MAVRQIKKVKGIGEQEAIDIALRQASINEEDTTRLKVSKDMVDGDYTYVILFSDESKSYEYTINSSGEILSSDRNSTGESATVVDDNKSDDKKPDDKGSSDEFNEEAAFKKALEHAGVAEADAMILKIEREHDDGEITFDIRFRTETSNYEYEVGSTGAILDYEVENYYNNSDIVYTRPTYYYTGATRYYYSGPTRYIDPINMISEEEAISLVMQHAGVNKDEARITQFERDDYEYEIDFVHSNYKYQYEISFDGVIIKSKKKIKIKIKHHDCDVLFWL